MKTVKVEDKEIELPYSITVHFSKGAIKAIQSDLNFKKMTDSLVLGIDVCQTLAVIVGMGAERGLSEIAVIKSGNAIAGIASDEEELEKMKGKLNKEEHEKLEPQKAG